MRLHAVLLLAVVLLAAVPSARAQKRPAPTDPAAGGPLLGDLGQGELVIQDGAHAGRAFPLAHTAVNARIDGIVSRVSVTQVFTNPYAGKIEAIYIFPLPDRAAVDDMEMKVGDRTIRAVIKTREEARRTYEEAKARGHVASLLDQERPNIFTQSVANILPGNQVEVTIRYVETLAPERGAYAFVFPMVVGPRFIPGAPIGPPLASREPFPLGAPAGGPGWSPDTDLVPDASRITPPVLRPGERSGHDIAVTLTLEAGLPIQEIASPSHAMDIARPRPTRAVVTLHPADTIPNKDLVVRYRLAGKEPVLTVLAHRENGDGTFLALIVPPAVPAARDVMPKEMVFVLDCSGSMAGEPIAKSKQAMRYALKHLDPRDSFQIIRFSERASGLGPRPLPATPANVRAALRYVDQLEGEGGTMMIEGIKAALDFPPDRERLRIVCFMTDGYIGNEAEILAAIEERLAGARLFSFGIGTAVNRYLLDRMAAVGRGAVDYVLLAEDTAVAVARFYDRVKSPVLTDITCAGAENLGASAVYPERIPDLFAGQTVTLIGRYAKPGRAHLTLSGRLGGRPWSRTFAIDLPARTDAQTAALASVWARTRIEDLMARQYGGEKPEIVREVTALALAHRLVSAYTSFVAVEERIETAGGVPRTVVVPVEMPEGVSYESVFGEGDAAPVLRLGAAPCAPMSKAATPGGRGLPFSIGSTPARDEAHGAETAPAPRPAAPARSLHAAIAADRTSARSGEPITLTITLTNVSATAAILPAPVAVGPANVVLSIIDANWREVGAATSGRDAGRGADRSATQSLAPGATITFRVTLGGPGGIRLPGSGTYHVSVASAGGIVVDSDLVTIHVAG
jgi:Ca-activated chloride channel family protein